MLIVKVCGGLGNQMFQYAFYEFLKKNNENVYLDVSDFKIHKHHTGYELERVFGVNANEADTQMLRSIAVNANSPVIRCIRKLYKVEVRTFKECVAYYPFISVDEQKIEDDVYFDGFWQNTKYLEPVRVKLEKTFQYKNILTEKNKELENFIAKNECVALHVRRGDYLNSAKLSNVCNLDYYKKAIEYVKTEVNGICKFVVFSDDMKWAKDHLGLPEDTVYVDWNTGKDSYIDMQLMGMCKHSIIANSTFSWWPAWLKAEKSDGIIIMPKRWFTDENSERLTIKRSIKL